WCQGRIRPPPSEPKRRRKPRGFRRPPRRANCGGNKASTGIANRAVCRGVARSLSPIVLASHKGADDGCDVARRAVVLEHGPIGSPGLLPAVAGKYSINQFA